MGIVYGSVIRDTCRKSNKKFAVIPRYQEIKTFEGTSRKPIAVELLDPDDDMECKVAECDCKDCKMYILFH